MRRVVRLPRVPWPEGERGPRRPPINDLRIRENLEHSRYSSGFTYFV